MPSTQDYATGKAYALGVFALKLRVSTNWLKQCGERFYLLGAPKWMFDPGFELRFSDYPLVQHPEVGEPKGKETWRNGSPFRLPLEFKEAGKDECDCVLLSSFLSADAGREIRYGLAYALDKQDGVILFQGQNLHEYHACVADLAKADEKRAEKKVGQRRIAWPGLWQPEWPWTGPLTLWRLPKPLPYIDSHLHIQSNHTAPLPLVWDKFPASDFIKALEPGWETKGKKLLHKEATGAVLGLLTGQPWAAFALGGLLIRQFRSGQISVGMDDVSKLVFGESGEIAANPTDVVGGMLAKELSQASGWDIPFYPKVKKGKDDSVWALATPLPMDMEYGHFRGYFGEKIYRPEKDGFSFSLNPFTGERGRVDPREALHFEDWEKQKTKTKTAAEKDAWRLLPMFHVDPRRYRDDGKSDYVWDEAFDEINRAKAPSKFSRPFVGVKMYTSLGYMPQDPLLPWQDKIYGQCEKDGIPIINHCTVQGMYTHEKPFYYDLWDSDPALRDKLPRWDDLDDMREKLKAKAEGKPVQTDVDWAALEKKSWREKCRWFERHYVFPIAWESVVKAHPKLKLCLAHFCGYDFWGDKGRGSGHIEHKTGMIYGFTPAGDDALPDPNGTNQLVHQLLSLIREDNQVHADLSFFFFTKHNREALRAFFHWAQRYKGGFLLDRILWGTDWPLLVTDRMFQLRSDMMRKYVAMNYKEICAIDPELWIRFTVLNPARFFGLRELVPHLEKVLKTPAPEVLKNIPYTLDELHALGGKQK